MHEGATMSEPSSDTGLPLMMTVVEIAEPGGPEVLRVAKRPRPQPQTGEVLIEVAAAGVNRPDLLQRAGSYPPPPGASDIPGLEVAGRVAAVGAGVTEWQVGDSVCALTSGGGYATHCVVAASQCLPIPAGLSMVAAAGLPETVFTVWSNVFERGRLRAGESFLVHGGAGGIGTMAIQLASAFGATVFATARGVLKCEACVALGAKRAINYLSEDFVTVIRAETGNRGVDLVLDMMGAEYLGRNLDALAEEGRHVSIAFLTGGRATFSVRTLMAKRLTMTGSTLRPMPLAAKAALAAAVREHVWPLVADGRLRPVIYATLPLAKAAEAHELVESNQHIGKVILTCV